MEKPQVIRDLQRSKELLLPFFDMAPAFLAGRYAAGKWTARQILAHLVDVEVLTQERTRLILSQPDVPVPPMDPDRWAKYLGYGERRMDLGRQLFRACRESLVELVDLLPLALFSREARHPERPGYRAWDAVTQASTHTMHHYGQLVAIRDGKAWPA